MCLNIYIKLIIGLYNEYVIRLQWICKSYAKVLYRPPSIYNEYA